jgi:hypothetical protein
MNVDGYGRKLTMTCFEDIGVETAFSVGGEVTAVGMKFQHERFKEVWPMFSASEGGTV